jgi:tRNA pseudouridine32 synthase/23S rRNA pseudouridine746 synthase
VPPQFTIFSPPLGVEVPERMPDPFDEGGPGALARAAAEHLVARLPPLGEGKMFGVLVARDGEGRLGYLAAFSGMLDGRWDHEGFSPPIFDRAARAAIEEPGERVVKGLLAQASALAHGAERAALAREAEALEEALAGERAALATLHAVRRERRRALRAAGGAAPALDEESRADKAARRRLEERHEQVRRALAARAGRIERRLRALERLRRMVSRRLMQQIHDSYQPTNARGERRSLRALYAPAEPPAGAGDCAAPKLLAQAHAAGLRPVALAELWWGPPPATGGRQPGLFYPPCPGKCGPLLPFLLEGVPLEPLQRFQPPEVAGPLAVLFEDPWLIVVEKPAGLLSVPGRDPRAGDSVLGRVRARCPEARGPIVVQRLDMDTSGLLVAAKDAGTHAALQRQFAERAVHKRYVAWLDGSPPADCGRVELPLRVDLEARPRQIPDAVYGRPALTEWRVLERAGARTRVALFPRTGRTHQLRVHTAHPLGLGVPIVGDRLYGRPGDRLLLHAEQLSFVHPHTGARLSFESRAPF